MAMRWLKEGFYEKKAQAVKHRDDLKRRGYMARIQHVRSQRGGSWFLLFNLAWWWYNHLKKVLRWIIMRASFWTQVGAMALPLGVSLIALATVLNEQKDRLIIAGLLSIVIGFVSFIFGWVYLVQEEREATNRRNNELVQHKNDEARNQQEHDEIMAILAGTLMGRRMSSPRILRFIEKLREIEGRRDEDEL